jgi:PadR family transcriptional regulator, regulatory protein AphA
MNFTLIEREKVKIAMCIPDGNRISSEADALEAVAACGEFGTDKLIIPGLCLSDAFYDLKSGLAGDVLLKFSNYLIKTAIVVPAEMIGQGKFYEFVLETNRGKEFRVFQDREKAVNSRVMFTTHSRVMFTRHSRTYVYHS